MKVVRINLLSHHLSDPDKFMKKSHKYWNVRYRFELIGIDKMYFSVASKMMTQTP